MQNINTSIAIMFGLDLKEGNEFVMTNAKSLRHRSEFACVGNTGSLSL